MDVPGDILQENHYYPFGMNMNYGWMNAAALDNRYRYNGKELNEEFGLNWNDYGARWFEASVGRWWSVDALADKYGSHSPYNFVLNNPINAIDPDGRDVILLIWASHDGKVGHTGIAISNYKEVSTRVKENGKWVTKTEKIADGTYTYRDLWPGGDGADKQNFDKDIEASYNKGVFTLDDLKSIDVTGSEGYAAGGVIQLSTDAITDWIVNTALDAHEKYNPS